MSQQKPGSAALLCTGNCWGQRNGVWWCCQKAQKATTIYVSVLPFSLEDPKHPPRERKHITPPPTFSRSSAPLTPIPLRALVGRRLWSTLYIYSGVFALLLTRTAPVELVFSIMPSEKRNKDTSPSSSHSGGLSNILLEYKTLCIFRFGGIFFSQKSQSIIQTISFNIKY